MSRAVAAGRKDTARDRRAVPAELLALGATALLAFAWLGATDVVRMEGIVAEGARAMLAGEGWSIPRIHGVRYTYKPPLAYWLTAGSFTAFGESAWALRLPFALASMALCAGVIPLTRSLVGARAAAIAGFASTSGLLFLQKARMAEFDVLIAAGVGVAVVAACANLAAERPRTPVWIVAGLGLAFGFLAKGPIALLLYGAGTFAAAAALRRKARLLSAGHLGSLGLTAAITGTWAWCAWRAGGAEAWAGPLDEASIRALDWRFTAFMWTLAKPVVAVALFLPWSVVALRALVPSLRASLLGETRSVLVAALGATVGGILALCALPTFEPRYFLPLAAPLGLAAAVAITARGGPARRPTLAQAVVLIALAWLVEVRVLEPRRAQKRSQRAAATVLDARLPADATVWTIGEDEHSSLFFYLDRTVRSFASLDRLPPAGAWLLLAERSDRAASMPAGVALVDEARHGAWRYVLARVVGADESGGATR